MTQIRLYFDEDAMQHGFVTALRRALPTQRLHSTPQVVTYHVRMQFGGTVLYVDQVSVVVDFYRRAFGLELRFFDDALGFVELETGGSTLAIAAHSLGEMLMPNRYKRPVDGQLVGVEIAFLTSDVAASFAKAIAEGASPITAPRRMPWGLEVAYVRSPEGTLIGFSEPHS